MKAVVIASVLFFSLRAMSTDTGEKTKCECSVSNSSAKREAKVLPEEIKSIEAANIKTISK